MLSPSAMTARRALIVESLARVKSRGWDLDRHEPAYYVQIPDSRGQIRQPRTPEQLLITKAKRLASARRMAAACA